MRAYLDLLREALETGAVKGDRTGTGVRSVFGRQLRFDLSQGFPLVTTKKLHLRSIVHELIWFLNGETNIAYLKANKVSIWDEWADEGGELGPVYGKQWRSWEGADGRTFDQIAAVVAEIKRNPESRRLDRLGLECRRHRADEAGAVPLPVPVLRRQRPAVVPALPALRRPVPRRALQHRELRAADPSGRARMRSRGRRLRSYARRRACLQQPRRAGARAAFARAAPAAAPAAGALAAFAARRAVRYFGRRHRFEGYEPWPAIKAPVAV